MAGDRKILDKAAIQVNNSKDVHFNVVSDPQIRISARIGGHCPACNRFNPAGYFKCGDCGRDYFCPEHFNQPSRLCPSCVEAAIKAQAEKEWQARRDASHSFTETNTAAVAGAGTFVVCMAVLMIYDEPLKALGLSREGVGNVTFGVSFGSALVMSLLAWAFPWRMRQIFYATLFAILSGGIVGGLGYLCLRMADGSSFLGNAAFALTTFVAALGGGVAGWDAGLKYRVM